MVTATAEGSTGTVTTPAAGATTAPATQSNKGIYDSVSLSGESTGESAGADKTEDTGTSSSESDNQTGTESEENTSGEGEGENDSQESHDDKPKGSTESPIVIRGRSFAQTSDLVKAYEQSSDEGLRLNASVKEMQGREIALKKQIVEIAKSTLQDKFPGQLSDEAIDSLPASKLLQYKEDLENWKRTQGEKRAEIAKMEREFSEHESKVTEIMSSEDTRLRQDTERYPDYEATANLRQTILKEAPYLNGKEGTHYITYLIAQGLARLNEMTLSRKKSAQSGKNAAGQASAASANAQHSGGRTGSGGKRSDGVSPVVSAYKARQGY